MKYNKSLSDAPSGSESYSPHSLRDCLENVPNKPKDLTKAWNPRMTAEHWKEQQFSLSRKIEEKREFTGRKGKPIQ